jgi:lipopolysaccharide/colanic/teichoic acid biosynthesis glycosyltransferase
MKRLLDVTVSIIALVLLSPFLILLAVAVAIFLGRPIFFRQKRAGRNGQPFEIIKFRTMTDARSESGALLADEFRLTKFGRILRSTSLDELPELINVIRGEMSLVGPRPLLIHYLPLYSAEQNRRHDVLPGVTGWAQVNGRNSVEWDERLGMDVWYVDHRSLWLDARIVIMTFLVVFNRRGVSAEGHATMPEFSGSANEVVA